jgi:hypothetical protein
MIIESNPISQIWKLSTRLITKFSFQIKSCESYLDIIQLTWQVSNDKKKTKHIGSKVIWMADIKWFDLKK